ncbi:MAG: cell division protein FtsZ, partial [Rhodospirillales bacterium]|nr:cell division protein FtsZ [Rhodospirillales bacterium]
MTLNLNVPSAKEQLSPRITVIGVGGAGGNAVNNMIQSSLEGVDFLVANTDAQALAQTLCDRSIQLGRNITQGLGAGSRPDIGRAAAEEALDEILGQLDGSNMVFVTAGMGGGTGTGAAPVIARAAREAGILTVGVVTKPFHFEGVHRMRLAESGITELQQYVDTLIIIPNQNLFRVANEKTTFADAFKMADDVLDSGVRGVTDLMVMPGLINLDFADIRAVMTEMGKAMMGTGEAEGENRSVEAAEAAISNPLLDDVSMKGARGVLINITGGADMTLFEVDETANRIRDEIDPEANIIFGSTFVQSLEGRIRVSVVATGIDAEEVTTPHPVALSLVSSRASTRAVAAPEITQQAQAAASPSMSGAYGVQSLAVDTDAGDPDARGPLMSSEPARHVPTELSGDDDETPAIHVESPGLIRSAAPMARRESETSDRRAAAEESTEGFIAPPPAEPDTSPSLPVEAGLTRAGSPETEPTRPTQDRLAGETREPVRSGRRRSQSLFARVSDAARAFQGTTQSSTPSETPEESLEHRTPAVSAALGDATPSAAEAPRQHELAGFDPAERIGASA